MVNEGNGSRIALMVDRFVPKLGGLESWSHDLAVELTARGHNVRIITTEAESRPPGVSIQLIPRSPRLLEQASLFAEARQTLPGWIIHDTGAGLGADILQPQTGCRLLNLERDNAAQDIAQRFRRAVSPRQWRWRSALRRLERLQLERSRQIVAVSQESAAQFRSRYGVPKARIVLIPNGIDTASFHPGHTPRLREAMRKSLNLPPTALVLLAAAGNFHLKGVHHVLHALAHEARDSGETILLVAGAGDIPAFAALAHRLGVAERIRFLGQRNDMSALFSAADVFVHLTAHDACSLATLEALASGLPVVTTRRNGAADGMVSGREGFVLDRPDGRALAAMLPELRAPARRAEMGQAARRLATRHDFSCNVDRIEALYANLQPVSG